MALGFLKNNCGMNFWKIKKCKNTNLPVIMPFNFSEKASLTHSFELCLTLCDAMDCSPPGSSVHGDSPGKNTGVGSHAPHPGIFLI